ncbi:MAG: TusE/DsrC/DsvC family sulfur relay protein [Pseudohongiellaceae bacterium]
MRYSLVFGDRDLATDAEGYLKNLDDWDKQVAVALAANEHIVLDDCHWEIIHLLRDFYARHQLSPAMRPLVNLVKRDLGEDKGRSIYLMKLFGGSPAKTATKLAGLPRPDNCL